MDLYLLRHAIASNVLSAGMKTDADRPLTDEGCQQIQQVAEGMKAMELYFDLVLCSPYLRARQTAETVMKVLGLKAIQHTDQLVPYGSRQKLVQVLASLKQPTYSVLLVSHEPFLGELISYLLTKDTSTAFEMRKAALCKISVENLNTSPLATFRYLLTPEQLSLIA